MKRTSMLAAMVATALLGIAALGSTSASADVLCKDIAFSYNCPVEDTYEVGTEFHAWESGTVRLNSKFNDANMVTCDDSQFDWTVTDAGGPMWNIYPKTDTTNLSFSDCGDDSISVVDDGTGLISRNGFGGSQQGLFYPQNLQIKVLTNWLYNGAPLAECVYKVVGSGTIVGRKTDGTNVTKVVFTKASAEKISGGTPCVSATFSGQYNFPNSLNFEGEDGIYVLPE